MFCYICSKYLFAHHLAALYCGHMFHLPCISGWIKNYQYCPVCQKQAGENDIISRLFFSTEKGYNDDDVDGNDYDDDSDDDDSDDDGDDTDDEDDINEDNYDDDDLDEDFIDGDDDIYIQYDDDIMDDGVCANDSLDFSD
uniref:RING-type domain-containing protein n=1 Tax=Setaria digitata TaxID=48799 RepID=A0A915PJ37_9BILA